MPAVAAELKIDVTLGDEHYQFDLGSMYLSDWFAIKSASGLTQAQFGKGLADLDPAALQCLVWYLRQKAGRPEDIRTVDFRMGDLSIEESEPDPTEVPAIETSSGTVATSTSDSSPITATSDPVTSTA